MLLCKRLTHLSTRVKLIVTINVIELNSLTFYKLCLLYPTAGDFVDVNLIWSYSNSTYSNDSNIIYG